MENRLKELEDGFRKNQLDRTKMLESLWKEKNIEMILNLQARINNVTEILLMHQGRIEELRKQKLGEEMAKDPKAKKGEK